MNTTPTTNSFKFHVLPEDGPQWLHDALDQITKAALNTHHRLTAIPAADLPDQLRGTLQEAADELKSVASLSEQNRRALHILISSGPVTATISMKD